MKAEEIKTNKKSIITTTMLSCFQTSVKNGHITQDRMVELLNEKALEFATKYAEECVKASLQKASENYHFIDEDGYYFEYLKPNEVTEESNIVLL